MGGDRNKVKVDYGENGMKTNLEKAGARSTGAIAVEGNLGFTPKYTGNH